MSTPAYITPLGGGLYLDSEGVLHQGTAPSVPSYPLPNKVLSLMNDASKLAKTFNDIGGALPTKADGAKFDKFAKKLEFLGTPEELSKIFGKIGEIASVIGNVFIVVGVVVAAAKLLGLFDEGPSPLESLIKARFDALDVEIKSLQRIISEQKLDQHKDALQSARAAVESFVSQRDGGTLSAAEIESRLQTLVALISVVTQPDILGLVESTTYGAFFEANLYEKVWPWMATNLFTGAASEPRTRAVFPAINALRFDHRLAVILGPQATQTVLSMLKSISPEFRTTGDFRPQLRDIAGKLSDLAASILNSNLARTIHTESDFSLPIDDFWVHVPIFGLGAPTLTPDYVLWVGGLDLCNHNDAFFADVVKAQGPPLSGSSRRGGVDFRWHPPAKLQQAAFPSGLVHTDGSPVIQYQILNAKECADAANQQSEQDYADLLVSSGYLTLVHLSAQLRHATTQPDHSETVNGDTVLLRHPQQGSEVTVHSKPGPVLFSATGDISARAWREPQKIRAFTSCSTQQIPRVPPLIPYRVFLRTLSSATANAWIGPNYGHVQFAEYVPDPLHPGFMRLNLTNSSTEIMHEELLFEGLSQAEPRHFDKTLTFPAHTFDWWIPVKPIPGVSDTAHLKNHSPRVEQSAVNFPLGVPRTTFRSGSNFEELIEREVLNPALVTLGIGWEDGAQTWKGHHREVSATNIQVHVKAEWQRDHLRIEVENRPEDRNYVLFLVVEETFGSIDTDEHAPKVLHTPFSIAINGQLTFVPQSLFDEETAANAKLKEFLQHYAKSTTPKVGDPISRLGRLGELATDAGVERFTSALRQFNPEEMNRLIHEFKRRK